MTRRLRAAAAAALAAVTLSGCVAEVDTRIEVTGAQEATITVAAHFTGEAGEVLATDTTSRNALIDTFTVRTGTRPAVDVTDRTVRVASTVDYDTLADLADVTGVTGVTLADDGGTATVGYGPATGLRDAVAAENAGDVDADALTATMLESTKLSVTVVYPGGVQTADADTGVVRTGGDTVTHTRTAADTTTGTLTVNGDPTAVPRGWWAAGAAALLAAGVWFRRRR